MLKGSLAFCDVEGFEEGAKIADLRRAKTLGRGEGALMAAALAKRGQGEVVDPRFLLWRNVCTDSTLGNDHPGHAGVQVSVISSVEYHGEVVGEDPFSSACQELEMFYNISRNEGMFADDFVVVLTRLDLFVQKLRATAHVADDGDYYSIQELQQMKEVVAGIIPKYSRGGRRLPARDYIFTVASHTIPTDREIMRLIAPKTFQEEQVRWIRKNDNALEVLSKIVTQVRHRRQEIGSANEHTFVNTKMHQFCRWLASDKTKHDVFLSYQQANLRQALGRDEVIGVIRNGLRHYGLGVYCGLDKKETHRIGDIFQLIKDARDFAAVLTKDYFKSSFCLAELVCASRENKQIFYIIGLNETGSRQLRHSLGAFKPDKVLSDLFESKGDLNGWYKILKRFYKKNDVERFVLTSLTRALKNAEDKFGLPLEAPQELKLQMKAQQRFMDWFKERWVQQMKEKVEDV